MPPISVSRKKSVGQRRRRQETGALFFNVLAAFGCRMNVLDGNRDAKRIREQQLEGNCGLKNLAGWAARFTIPFGTVVPASQAQPVA